MMKQIFAIGAFFVVASTITSRVMSAQYYNAAYQSWVNVYEFGECYGLYNNCQTNTMFIPTKTTTEWSAVKTSSPACLTKQLNDPCNDCGACTTTVVGSQG